MSGYITCNVSAEISFQDIIDSMDDYDKRDLAKEIDLDSFKTSLKETITPRQILYNLRKYKVDIISLRDEILIHFPVDTGINKSEG